MKQAHKKRSPRATANSPPGLPDMGEIILIIYAIKSINFLLLKTEDMK